MIRVDIVADSLNVYNGQRLTSFLCTYPRFIHSEVMTHRAFSRNAASSRAIPIAKMIAAVREHPAMPVEWRANQRGMSPGDLLPDAAAAQATTIWLRSAERACQEADALAATGAHKQYANRLLEPYMHMVTLISATDVENFFALRSHPAAQQEIQELSDAMLSAYVAHTPTALDPGEWHAPFRDLMPPNASATMQRQIATARSARLSYVSFDKAFSVEDDVSMHDGLAAEGHWSPFEHIAKAVKSRRYSGNFCGFKQYRKFFPSENRRVDLPALAAERATLATARLSRRTAHWDAITALRGAHVR